MAPHQLPPDSAQCLVHRRDLDENIGAVAILLDHLVDSSHLPFDTTKPREVGHLRVGVDAMGLSQRGVRLRHYEGNPGRMRLTLAANAQNRFCRIVRIVARESSIACAAELRSPRIKLMSPASIATSVPVPI